MRQVHALHHAICRRKIEYRYPMMNFFAKLHNAEILSLKEIFETIDAESKTFDTKTDDILEKRALENLEKNKRGRQ